MKSETNARLAGRTALVTGAGSPAGRAICERFAREGAWIVAVDADFEAANAAAELARTARMPAIGLKTEALDPTITENIVETAIQRMWQIDILVNVTTPLADTSAKGATDWAATLAVNLEADFRFAHSVLPQMCSRSTGVIVTVGWCPESDAGPTEQLARATSEAAVTAFTRRLADDHGADGVRVNALCPTAGSSGTNPDPSAAANGATVRVPDGASPEQLADWITALTSLQSRPPVRRPAAIPWRE